MSQKDWRSEAACIGYGTGNSVFFPTAAGDAATLAAAAKDVCISCPVQTVCLEYAIINQIDHGIWGGATPTERDLIREQMWDPDSQQLTEHFARSLSQLGGKKSSRRRRRSAGSPTSSPTADGSRGKASLTSS